MTAVIVATITRVPGEQTVTLAPRVFSEGSPAAVFQQFISDARRRAAGTTAAWSDSDTDLSAWGPAVVFPLLASGVPTETIVALADPLGAEAPAPALLRRSVGLYAGKARMPFAETPALMGALRRNLGTLERATHDSAALAAGPGLSEWGTTGVDAWAAYLLLLYRDFGELGDDDAARWNAAGLRLTDRLLAHSRLPGGGGFRRATGQEELSLWPNALAIHALVQAYESTELVQYESAAVAAAGAVAALRDADGGYFSTAAKTQKDARANAYLAGALVLLFKDTGERQYRDAALGVLRWLSSQARAASLDVSAEMHAAYVLLLIDSLATASVEPLLGRRPMRSGDPAVASAPSIDGLAAHLRPAGFRYRDMLDAVLRTLLQRTPYAAGDFAYDYGDSPGYAAAVLLRAGDTDVSRQIIARQEKLLAWPRPLHFDEMSFGAKALLAALDHPLAVNTAAADTALRRYLLLSGSLAAADGYYCDWLDWFTNGGGFEYGPTSIGAQIAAPQLQYGARMPTARIGWWMQPSQVGFALLDGAARHAWDAERRVYRLRPGDATIALLPNAMMILDLVEAHRLAPARGYLERAQEVASALAALWDEERGAYFANSSLTGANAYESLSTNSYAALALLRLYAATGNGAYREHALRVFDFIRRDLYADGIVYHHLYRGRRATGDIWCSGCNWRVVHHLVALAAMEAGEPP